MTVNTHPHAKYTHVRVQWRSEVRELLPKWMGEGKISGSFYNKHVWILQKHQSYQFFNLENTTKLLIDTFKSFGKPWFSSQQQHSRRHQEGNPPERCPPSRFPLRNPGRWGEKKAVSRPTQIPTLSFLTWSAIPRRLSPNHSLKKSSHTGKSRGVPFGHLRGRGESTWTPHHCPPLLGSPCSGFLDPSARRHPASQ